MTDSPAFVLDPERTALILVDMQNDFVRAGAPLEVPDARATIPRQRELLDHWRTHALPVVFTKFIAGPRPTLMWKWSPVLAPPTRCCWPGVCRFYADVQAELDCTDVIRELYPLGNEAIVEKYAYDAFFNTNLPDRLRAQDVDGVVITGTVTQICVDETARGAFNHGFKAVTVSDAVSSYAPDLHAATLKNLAMKFGRVATTAEVLREMAERKPH